MSTVADLLHGLRLPDGWTWDEEQVGRNATITWPRLNLTMVVAHPEVAKREVLAPRFQLFDIEGGGFAKVAAHEEYHVILDAFDRVRMAR